MEAVDEKRIAAQRLDFVQSDYWRLRNGHQRFMRCPYCSPPETEPKDLKRNFPSQDHFCCFTFGKVLKAILDRQDEVNQAAIAARSMVRAMEGTPN